MSSDPARRSVEIAGTPTLAALRERVAELDVLFDLVPMPVVIAEDAACRFVRGNRAFNDLFSVPSGINVSATAPPAERPHWKILRDGRELGPLELPVQRAAALGIEVRDEAIDVEFDSGRTLHLIAAASPIFDAHGRSRGAVATFSDVTESRRTATALQESEGRLFALITATSDVVYRMNGDWSEMRLLFGRNFIADTSEPIRGWLEKYIPPEEQARVRQAIDASIRQPAIFELEHRVLRVDGSVGWTFSRAIPRMDARGEVIEWFGTATDITERKEAEEKLREVTKRLTYHVEHSPLAIIEFGPDMRLIGWSHEAERLFGWSADEVRGKRMEDFRWVYEEDVDHVDRVSGELQSGADPKRFSLNRNYRKDGTTLWCEWYNSALLDGAGRLRSIQSQVLDVTARIDAERALRASNERLVEADRRKDEFLAILSHELRNPLAPISFALPLLKSERLTDRGAGALAAIERQAAQLNRLVADLLDVSRISTGRITLRIEPVTARSVVAAAVEAAAPAIAGAGLALHVDVPDEDIWIEGDQVRLTQVLTNLLDNARKYTPIGGITVRVTRSDQTVEIAVQDTGIGLPTEALGQVFEMFWQVQRSEKPQGGLGIGLALARRLAELQGGSLEAKSDGPGRGAEFVASFPLAIASGGAAHAVRARTVAPPARVLVVDDNVDSAEMLTALLTGEGYEVRSAFDGASALAYRPDVVLLDIGLPGMNGAEVAAELRARFGSAMRIVAVTGWGPDQYRDAANAGFDLHLTKPVDPVALLDVVARLSRRDSAEAG